MTSLKRTAIKYGKENKNLPDYYPRMINPFINEHVPLHLYLPSIHGVANLLYQFSNGFDVLFRLMDTVVNFDKKILEKLGPLKYVEYELL